MANAVATKNASTELAAYDYGEDLDRGFEGQTSADYSVPFVSVLQQMSPQVSDPRDGGIEGAKPGMLINTVTGELWDGREGLEFVPAMTQHVFVEWVPREKGGGMVGRHEVDSDVVRAARANSSEFGKLRTREGNDLIETFYVYGVLCSGEQPAENVILAFTSTKIKIYKNFNTRVGFFMVQTPNGKRRPPLFSHLVKITTSKGSLKLAESRQAMNTINAYASTDAHVIFGAAYDESLGDEIRVTVVATGLSRANARRQPISVVQGGLRTGTGLLLDLGKSVTVTDVQLTLGSEPGADIQVRVGGIPSVNLPTVASAWGAGGTVRLTAATPAAGRYVLIWFTRLPADGQGHYQVNVYNVSVDGVSG